MKTASQTIEAAATWPPARGALVTFKSSAGVSSGVLEDLQWGLVWRNFILRDGRVIPEHKVLGCPDPPVWRDVDEISQSERESWEERLVAMTESGVDPHDREQCFWAELNQYLAFVYLKFNKARS